MEICASIFVPTAVECNTEERNPQFSMEAARKQDLTTINSTPNNYMSAWKAENADLLTNLYTDDAVVLYPN